MLTKALNNPKKWGWLLEPDEFETDVKTGVVTKTNNEMSVDEMLTLMGRSGQKQAYMSSLFQFDDLNMYEPQVSDILNEKQKKPKKKPK